MYCWLGQIVFRQSSIHFFDNRCSKIFVQLRTHKNNISKAKIKLQSSKQLRQQQESTNVQQSLHVNISTPNKEGFILKSILPGSDIVPLT